MSIKWNNRYENVLEIVKVVIDGGSYGNRVYFDFRLGIGRIEFLVLGYFRRYVILYLYSRV